MMPTVVATPSPAKATVLLWLSAIVLIVAFYFGTHDPMISLASDYLPSEEDLELTAGGGSFLRRVAFPSIAALGLVLVALSDRRAREGDKRLAGVVLFYLAWCALSMAWSAEPGLSFRRFIVMSLTLVGAWGIARALPLRSLCVLTVIVLTAFTGIGVATELALGTFAPGSPDYRFAGTTHPNTQSDFAACLVLVSVCLATEKTRWRPLWVLLACVGVVSLLLADSRTSAAAVMTALFAAWAVRRSLQTATLAVVGIICLASMIMLVSLLSGAELEQSVVDNVVMARNEEPFSLNGRIPLWKELIPFALEHPILGYGYEGFWNIERTDAVSDALEWRMAEAHSAYLETMLGGGLLGLAAFLVVAWFALKDSALAYRSSRDAGHAFVFALIVYCALSALLESGISKPTFLAFIMACGIWHLILFRSESRDAEGLSDYSRYAQHAGGATS
jgi:O-antigen ligase